MNCCCNTNRENIHSTRLEAQKNKIPFSSTTHHNEKMTLLEGTTFLMGSEDSDVNRNDNEGPIHKVEVSSFWIDTTPVTNKEFKDFIDHTGYKTDAEKYGWSFVFHLLLSEKTAKQVTQIPTQAPWWRVVEGADWAHPEGLDSTIAERLDHPVVHVSWNDAQAYAEWAGKRLPTEEEWEYAARGGLEQKRYPWGDELTPQGKHRCNIWQGEFPYTNTAEDGYQGTSPVKAFPTNSYGIYSVAGNVWEWCENDFFQKTNPPENAPKATRGGSYLCHASYCNRYRVAARTSNTPDSSTGNIGFRCAKDVD